MMTNLQKDNYSNNKNNINKTEVLKQMTKNKLISFLTYSYLYISAPAALV